MGRRRLRLLPQGRELRRLALLLWPHARPHRGLLATGAALSLGLVALRVAQPWPLKWIIDALTGEAAHGWLAHLVAVPRLGIAGLSLTYVGITALAAATEYGQLLVLAGLGNQVLYSFRSALFTHVLRQPLEFHEGRDTGELLTRVVYDTARLRQGVNGLLTRVFQTAAVFVATAGVLVWLNSKLAAVLAVSGVAALISMTLSGSRIARAARKQRQREGRLASLVAEDLLGVRELQTYRAGAGPDERFVRSNKKSLRQEQKVRRLGAGLLLRVEVLLALSVTLILWIGARDVQAGRITPGDLVLFVSYVVALYRPFSQFARHTVRSGKTFACAERLTTIMAAAPAIADRPGAVPVEAVRGAVGLDRVSVKPSRKHRGARPWALREVTCTVAPGERVAILGANGAGKSTLLRLVPRLLEPTEGRVSVDGRDVRDYTVDSLRRQCSVVFQESVFFGLSVRDNIALGDPAASAEAVRQAAERARAAEFISRLPQAYDTPVRHRGGLFSGGERQRIALARAMLRDGRIWLLDEPTTGIDRAAAQELVQLLLAATAGRTVLWVTHDPEIVSQLDRVLVLADGAVAFDGVPATYGRWLARRVSGAPTPAGEEP